MFIGCQKFIIKKNFPLFVEHLPVAMGHKDLVRTLPTRIHNGKFFERVGELKNQNISIGCWLNGEADSLEVCNMVAQLVEMCSLPYREGECPEAWAKQSIAWYSDDKTVSTLCECLPKASFSNYNLHGYYIQQ
jgi:hypothetical protein